MPAKELRMELLYWEVAMPPERDFRPQQLYGVTQRGNQGQWVYRDDQDFQQGLGLSGHQVGWKRGWGTWMGSGGCWSLSRRSCPKPDTLATCDFC